MSAVPSNCKANSFTCNSALCNAKCIFSKSTETGNETATCRLSAYCISPSVALTASDWSVSSTSSQLPIRAAKTVFASEAEILSFSSTNEIYRPSIRAASTLICLKGSPEEVVSVVVVSDESANTLKLVVPSAAI